MTYTPRRKRMAHQDRAIAAAASAPANPCPDDAFAFVMDYGTGKSQTILDEWGGMATSGGPRDLLVIAPAGSYRNWFEDKSDLQRAEIYSMDPAFARCMSVGHWRSGGGKKHRDALARFMRESSPRDDPRALFVNVEALSQPGRARELVEEYASQRHCYGAIDESTKIKGRKSERSKFLVRKISPKLAVRRIATGLLTPQGPMDAYTQFAFLDRRILGCRSYQDFQGRYAITRRMMVTNRHGREVPVELVVDYRDLDDLQERMAPYSFRVLKSECLDLEPKKYVLWETEHTDEQRRVYREMRDDAVAKLGGGQYVTSERVLTQVMRLHQINCGFATDEEGDVYDIPSRREQDIVEILGMHRGKAVIWTPFRRPIPKIRAAIEEAFQGVGVAEFHGGNKRTRGEDERRFLSDQNCKYMIATESAGGRGNTWTCADLEIYHSNSNDLENRTNSEDRLHRKGQVNRVTVVDIIVPDTVDMKIVRRLRRKMTVAATLTGEEAMEWLI